MNRLTTEERAQVVAALVEGASINRIEVAFGADIDYAMVIKMYSDAPTGNETR